MIRAIVKTIDDSNTQFEVIAAWIIIVFTLSLLAVHVLITVYIAELFGIAVGISYCFVGIVISELSCTRMQKEGADCFVALPLGAGMAMYWPLTIVIIPGIIACYYVTIFILLILGKTWELIKKM